MMWTKLKAAFNIKHLGPLEGQRFVGLQIDAIPDGMKVHQATYVAEVLALIGMSACKAAPTPAVPGA